MMNARKPSDIPIDGIDQYHFYRNKRYTEDSLMSNHNAPPRRNKSAGTTPTNGNMRKAAPGHGTASSTSNQAAQPPMNHSINSKSINLPTLSTITENLKLAQRVRKIKRETLRDLKAVQREQRDELRKASQLDHKAADTARKLKAAQMSGHRKGVAKHTAALKQIQQDKVDNAHKRSALGNKETHRIRRIENVDIALTTVDNKVTAIRHARGTTTPPPPIHQTVIKKTSGDTITTNKSGGAPAAPAPKAKPIPTTGGGGAGVKGSSTPGMGNYTTTAGGQTFHNAGAGTPIITRTNTYSNRIRSLAQRIVTQQSASVLSNSRFNQYTIALAQTLQQVLVRGTTLFIGGTEHDAIDALDNQIVSNDEWWGLMAWHFNTTAEKIPYHGFSKMVR